MESASPCLDAFHTWNCCTPHALTHALSHMHALWHAHISYQTRTHSHEHELLHTVTHSLALCNRHTQVKWRQTHASHSGEKMTNQERLWDVLTRRWFLLEWAVVDKDLLLFLASDPIRRSIHKNRQNSSTSSTFSAHPNNLRCSSLKSKFVPSKTMN